MIYVLIPLLVLIAAFFAVILIRTATFKPAAQEKTEWQEEIFDRDAATDALGELVKCKTVSRYAHEEEDDAEFEKLISLLPSLYPHVYAHCTLQRMPDRGLLFRWPGKTEGEPAVMMAHYDVVPVNEDKWDKPPFSAIIEDGMMWGRGTLDTKVTFNGVLSAANSLIEQGFTPKNDMYFAFSGNEEVNGNGAVNIVNYFVENGIQPALVVDEGGAVVEGVFRSICKV
jgi:carboxypeptidase PM20D1